MREGIDYRHLEVSPVAGALGAEVQGVDLARPLAPEVVSEIRQALLAHLVLFFHVGAAAAGTAALGLAFALALLYLASEKQAKSKRPGRLFARLPSLDLLDKASYQLAVVVDDAASGRQRQRRRLQRDH